MTTSLQLAIAALFFVCLAAQSAHAARAAERLSGPYTHGNLTIFLVHGPDTLKGEYLTLEEALEAKAVKVHETGDVNELAIENVGKTPVFVQSGDIVKGGKQDRCIGTDFTLAPDSGKVKIAAFCVEQGRWRQRGGESAALFGSSSDAVTGKALKLAGNANYSAGGGQQKVWDEVKTAQERLSSVAGASVAPAESPSSLQLTLENEKVRETVDQYVETLASAPKGKEDVIGYAAVVNGKLNCADVYGSHALFLKLWPKQLKSIATEAAGESKAGEEIPAVDAETVEAALYSAEDGKKTENDVNGQVKVTTIESAKNVTFESRPAAADAGGEAYLRRSIITKE